VEDDKGGESDAFNAASEEGGDVGDDAAGDTVTGLERRRRAGDEEVGDVRGEGEERVGEATEEGAVAESGRVEPPSGSVHQQVQRGYEAAEAGVAETVQGDDDESRSSLRDTRTHTHTTHLLSCFFTPIIKLGGKERKRCHLGENKHSVIKKKVLLCCIDFFVSGKG